MKPRWQLRIFVLLLVILVGLTGYNYFARPFAEVEPPPASVDIPELPLEVVPPTDPYKEQLEQLTAAQKLGLVMAAPLTLPSAPQASGAAEILTNQLEDLASIQPGFVALFGSELSREQVINTLAEVTALFDPVIAVDHEGGRVQRLAGAGFTRLPSWSELCQQEDESRRADLLESSARELAEVGIHLVFAPMVDVGLPDSALGDRLCSDQQQPVVDRALEFTAAFEAAGIGVTFKHFPGIGSTTKDTHLAFDRVALTYLETDMFRAVLDEHPDAAVMIAHVGVQNQNGDIPCSLSPDCVAELLEAYPEVLAITDALDMAAAAYGQPYPSGSAQALAATAAQALEAGVAVVLFGNRVDLGTVVEAYDILLDRYVRDAEFAKVVDNHAITVLRYKNTVLELEK